MKIHLATDHAGFLYKESIKKYLEDEGNEVIDHGAFTMDDNDDYPDFITPCAEAVVKDGDSSRACRGIIFGGSGQGEAMCANRVKGVRAVVYYGHNTDILTLSREHNDANILSLGARFISEEECIEAVKIWLGTQFSNDERHIRRLNKF